VEELKVAHKPVGTAGQALPEHLQRHRSEMHEVVVTRLVFLLDQVGSPIPCRRGLETAVGAAVDFGLASMVSVDPAGLEIPAAVRSHARAAARAGIPLEEVLRAYTSGYTAFVEHALSAIEQPSATAATEMLRPLAAQLDRTVNAVVSEYAQALPSRDGVAPAFQTRLVQKLLRGDHVDAAALHYDFSGWHVGLIMEQSPGGADELRAAARHWDVRVLVAELGRDTLAVWFGSNGREKLDDLLSGASKKFENFAVAAGEPGAELGGWQLTYRQAESIWPYVQRFTPGVHRYAETGLIAAIAFNPVLARSMRNLYIEPLRPGPDGPAMLVETVRAYLSSGRNASSAAASLGLTRQTVKNRLRAAEERLGRSLDECGAEVEIALRLDHLEGDA
jgi:hypothetical protein